MTNPRDETLYQILNLPENCSTQDIKNSFIALSKSYHPDKDPTDKDQHAKFVKINNAYTILSKADTRRNYDISLTNYRNFGYHEYTETSRGRNRGMEVKSTAPNYFYRGDGSFWHNRDRTKERPIDDSNFYGIKGIKKKSNGVIALGCVGIMMIGVIAHYAIFRYRVKESLERLREQDQKLRTVLYNTRQVAIQNGNAKQLELINREFSRHANDTDPEDLTVVDGTLS